MQFIKRAQELGFTLDEVEEMLHLDNGGPEACDAARALAEHRRAPTRLPARRFSTTSHSGCHIGERDGHQPRCEDHDQLIALFTITAYRAMNPNTPISNGSRNPAPRGRSSRPSTPTRVS